MASNRKAVLAVRQSDLNDPIGQLVWIVGARWKVQREKLGGAVNGVDQPICQPIAPGRNDHRLRKLIPRILIDFGVDTLIRYDVDPPFVYCNVNKYSGAFRRQMYAMRHEEGLRCIPCTTGFQNFGHE
jgi:hypothetical protein